jgi:hypothetical protein
MSFANQIIGGHHWWFWRNKSNIRQIFCFYKYYETEINCFSMSAIYSSLSLKKKPTIGLKQRLV